MAYDELVCCLIIILANLVRPTTVRINLLFDLILLVLMVRLVPTKHVILTSKVFGMWTPCRKPSAEAITLDHEAKETATKT